MDKNQSVLNFLFQKKYAFHILFWVMYVVFMVLFSGGYIEQRGWVFALMPISLYVLLMAVLVYGHTLVLIPRFLERKKIVSYIVCLALLILFYTVAESLNQKFWNKIVYPKDHEAIGWNFTWNFFYAVCFILNSTLLYFTQRWSDQRQLVNQVQIDQLETELKYLRSQINPHFLFNGLNTIYGTIDIGNEEARDMVVQFSDLLRYNLYDADTELVAIGKEAVYLENYVALQKARSNENLLVKLDIRIADRSLKIAPLIFVAFVENAFKYVSRDLAVNEVVIDLEQEGNRVLFHCRNSYHQASDDQSGIGLVNVKRRLELIYKDRYALDIHADNDVYITNLSIEL